MLYLQVLEEEQNKILNAATESFKSESTIPSVDSLDAFSHSSQVELLMARAQRLVGPVHPAQSQCAHERVLRGNDHPHPVQSVLQSSASSCA